MVENIIISVRHEPPMGVNPVDIHGFQPPWKAFSEFALSGDPDRMDPSGPQFQHLVGQVTRSFKFEKFFLKIVFLLSCLGNISQILHR